MPNVIHRLDVLADESCLHRLKKGGFFTRCGCHLSRSCRCALENKRFSHITGFPYIVLHIVAPGTMEEHVGTSSNEDDSVGAAASAHVPNPRTYNSVIPM